MDWFFDIPWDQIAAFFGTLIAALTLLSLLGKRLPVLGHWARNIWRDITGVNDLHQAFEEHTDAQTIRWRNLDEYHRAIRQQEREWQRGLGERLDKLDAAFTHLDKCVDDLKKKERQ